MPARQCLLFPCLRKAFSGKGPDGFQEPVAPLAGLLFAEGHE